jgi:hypothetical protein
MEKEHLCEQTSQFQESNLLKKETEKIIKCKDLTTETERMWNIKAKAIPVIIRETGTNSKLFRKYPNNIPVRHRVKELQKTSVMSTAHKLRSRSTKHLTWDIISRVIK